MIRIGLDPVLVHLGPFMLRWYGLMIGLAFYIGLTLAWREARRKGLEVDDVSNIALWLLVAGIVGGRLLHVIDEWPRYAANPASIFAIQEGGLAIYGGVAGGLVAAWIYTRRHRLSLAPFADLVAPSLILGQAIGRIGCLINGDAYGAPTTLPWGVVWTNPGALVPQLGVAYHPTQLYEMFWDVAVFVVLWKLRTRLKADGALFLLYVILYSFGRFWITFLRQDAIVVWGLRQAQLIGLGAILICLPLLAARLWRRPSRAILDPLG